VIMFIIFKTNLEHRQSCAQYATLHNSFLHPSFSYLLFCNPTHKTETGIANRWGITSRENHLDQSLWYANQKKHWVAVRSHLLHSFVQVHSFGEPFTSHGKLCHYSEPKHFSWAKPAYFDFSSSNFSMQDHIGTTTGDALSFLFLILWNLDWFLFATVFL
jgi:hypothetical protein